VEFFVTGRISAVVPQNFVSKRGNKCAAHLARSAKKDKAGAPGPALLPDFERARGCDAATWRRREGNAVWNISPQKALTPQLMVC
jgi:hypothetical protein